MASNNELALVQVNVCGSILDAGKGNDGKVYIPTKRVCVSLLGIDDDAQRVKLQGCPWAVTLMIKATGPDGKKYETFCIDLDSLPMWLAGINPSKVKPEVRPVLIALQKEAKRVLAEHFFGRPAEAMFNIQVFAILDEITRMMKAQNDVTMAAIADLTKKVTAIEARQAAEAADPGGMIGKDEALSVCNRMQHAARQMLVNGDAKSLRSARGIVETKARSWLRFAGPGSRWANFPCSRRHELISVLQVIDSDVSRKMGLIKARAQSEETAKQYGFTFTNFKQAN